MCYRLSHGMYKNGKAYKIIVMKDTTKKHKIKNDIILIAAILVVAAIGLVLFKLWQKDGSTVVVQVEREIYGEYSLFENRVVEIISPQGTNILTIENGKAWVSEASCPGIPPESRCTNQHAISKTGESIQCRANRVVIAIE